MRGGRVMCSHPMPLRFVMHLRRPKIRKKLSRTPRLQQAAPPRQISNEGVNEEYFPIQTPRSLDKAGAAKNMSAPLIYVHTSAERDGPIL